jgi:catechol 2,3-dioxygenase-like lactoylglutathione lyase family enzyme
MSASAMSHVAICVRNVDRSLAFYRDLLGFRVVSDQVQDTTTGGLPHVYKNRHAQRRVVHLSYGEGDVAPRIVMTGHPGDTPDGDPIKLDQVGISHVSFTVANVAELTQELLAKGAQTCGPADAFKDGSGHVSTVFFLDPDGMLVQLDEGLS